MARYPDYPRPISPFNFRDNRPFVAGGPDWAPQSRTLTQYGLHECDVQYRGRAWTDIMVLHDFFESVGGAAGRFTFIDFNGIGPIGGTDPGVPWTALYVSVGDAVTAAWDSPTFGIKSSTTTVAASISAGTRTVTPASMSGITLGCRLTAVNADGTSGEGVTVTAITGTTFTAVFANAHTSSWLIGAPVVYENGVAKTTTVWVSGPTTPSAGTYMIVPGAGTDGVDQLKAGTAPTAGVIVTVDAVCRRALRRARFTTQKNPFVYNVPANYYADQVTIVEVRK